MLLNIRKDLNIVMDNNRRFTIIVPMHNAEEFIITALDSIKHQLFQDYECILIDDHSTDKTKELVQDYILNNPDVNIKLYETPQGK